MTETSPNSQDKVSAAATARPIPSASQPCRILLVEDNYDDRILAQKRLKLSPEVEDVLCFGNGTELIKYLYDQGFHDRTAWSMTPMVIILDLNMPTMDGFAVLQELKSDAFLAEIPVIVVSGTQSQEEIQRAFALKADGVFRKPINIGKLNAFFKDGWTWPRKEMWYY